MYFYSCSKHNYTSISAPCPDCSNGIKPQLCEGWRDVRKEIPEPLTTVLIYFNLFGIDQIETAVMKSDGEMMEDVFEYSKCGVVRVKNCIAWMPLSEIGKPAFA